MQAGYFKAAWNDVKNTPGWFGKMLLLALIACIPIFGAIVVAGYLYGWARDIAWGVHAPMPKHIFGNEDGKLYSRGFFVIVIGFVCALIPWIIEFVWAAITGFGSMMFGHGSYGMMNGGMFIFGGFTSLAFFVITVCATFVAMLFQWVGSMRMSVYGRLSAGFQFNKMWAMIRHDLGGLLRIFAMTLLMGLIIGIIFSILLTILIFIAIFIGFAATGGNVYYGNHLDGAAWGMIMGFGALGVIGMILIGYVALVVGVFIESIVVRALGYWTKQFEVHAWRGQDDPMPFELHTEPAHQGVAQYQQPYVQPQSYEPVQAHQQAQAQPQVGSPSQHEPVQADVVVVEESVATEVTPAAAPDHDVAKPESGASGADDDDKPKVD